LTLLSLFFIIHINENTETSFIFAAKPGDIWSKPAISAQYTFPVYKNPEVLLKEINKAKENTPPVFVYLKNAEVKALEYVDTTFAKILSADKEIEAVLNENFSLREFLIFLIS